MRSTLLAALLLLFALPAAAAEVPITWQFDDGKAIGTVQMAGKPLAVGSMLATGFRANHLAVVEEVEIQLWGTAGNVELHVWRDNGGSQPGAAEGLSIKADDADRMPPRTLKWDGKPGWIKVDLIDEEIQVAPLDQFWVGVKLVQPGVGVAIDVIEKDKPSDQIHSVIQTLDAPCNDVCVVPGDLLIRAHGRYLDPVAKTWFTDVTTAANVPKGGRMAWGDYDGDGDEDLLFGGNQLFRNNGKGVFEDVIHAAKLSELGGSGGLWGDFDNDGHLDIFVFGGKERLLRNLGNGTFVEVKTANFQEDPKRDFPTESAIWLDADLDGLLDVYTANYETVQKNEKGEDMLGICDPDFLWRNNGDGTFSDNSVASGIRNVGKQCGRSVAAADWDLDGDQDVFVNNYRLDPDFFFRNELPPLKFVDIAAKQGVQGSGKQGAYGHGTGATWVDADDDGDLDLFAANLAHPRFITFSDRTKFWQNRGSEKGFAFTEHRAQTGIGYLETHSDAKFADFDNDGDQDVAIGAYYGDRAGQFWRNEGKHDDVERWLRFTDISYPSGWSVFGCAHIAWADMDGDGDLDQMANRLFRNDHADVTGSKGHWLKVRLQGAVGVNRAAIGALVTASTGDGRTMSRTVAGGHGIGCQDSLVVHFGLGAAESVTTLTVRWPGGKTQTAGPFAADQVVTWKTGAEPVGTGVKVDAVDAGNFADGKADGGAAGDGGLDAVAKVAPPAATDGGGCSTRQGRGSDGTGALAGLVALACLGLRRARWRLQHDGVV